MKLRVIGATILACGIVALLAAVHLTQGTSSVGAPDLLGLLIGSGDEDASRVLVASRLPRMLAGLTVGVALGIAGAAFQSLARNALASPDTLAVNAGAHLAVVAVAAFGLSLPVIPAGGVAFVGGLAAAGLVMMLSAGGTGPTRLILAGSAIALALSSLTMLFLLLFEQETIGLFAWGNGSLVQTDLGGVKQMAPVVVASIAALLALGRRLDILALGEDTATTLGVAVGRTRIYVTVLAVLLSAAVVTLVGPIGFVGLCAPVIVRLAARWVPAVSRHRVLLVLSGLAGAAIVLGADILLRLALGGQGGVDIPTGVVTTVVGAVILVWLARRNRDSGPVREAPNGHFAAVRSRRFFGSIVTLGAILLCGALVVGMLAGDAWLLTGDLANWWQGRSGRAVTYVLDQRYPRVLAAILAGAALAVAGTVVQAVCRNPLAEPSLLGITGGAGVGAILLLTLVPLAGIGAMSAVAALGALLAFAVVYGLSGGSGDRLVLIGVGVSAGCMAVITFLILVSDPWNTGKALTWLLGSTYGRTAIQLVPVAIALILVVPLLVSGRRELDLLALDEDTPRVLGVGVSRARLILLGGAAILTSTAVSAAGVIGFVGLVAPHVARALVGARHTRLLPMAAIVGALLVSIADTLGRTVIAPAQVPAGLVTALIGTPYFAWLLWRAR